MNFVAIFLILLCLKTLYFVTKLRGQVTEQEMSLCVRIGKIGLERISFQEGERKDKVKVQRNRGFFLS